MSADDCLFCKMVAGQIPITKVYEDQVVLSFLDINPISDGHTLVISKQHFKKLHDCPAELSGQVFSRIGRIARAIMTAMNSDGYNVLCNNGKAAGQLIGHLHFHIIPRNTDDGLFRSWPSYEYKEGRIEHIAEAIRRNL